MIQMKLLNWVVNHLVNRPVLSGQNRFNRHDLVASKWILINIEGLWLMMMMMKTLILHVGSHNDQIFSC